MKPHGLFLSAPSANWVREDSLVVTHPTTNSPACGLSTAERTGSPIFHTLWSYVPTHVWERLNRIRMQGVERIILVNVNILSLAVKETKTYNSEDSLVVTHPTTNSPACGLSTAERTGSPVFHTLWSYVSGYILEGIMKYNRRATGRKRECAIDRVRISVRMVRNDWKKP
ncbi:hypothetical protein N7505_004135 [Penicillium chrysogenum]|uniref:Uncharacterized protein n=1 Tax=Penicillium chrysogenum TaxID=5076 RepID=A0ABQ8WSJ5_PENCH|nr:hypothetical protein N7505_004135 [Penicillium chrysogenum]